MSYAGGGVRGLEQLLHDREDDGMSWVACFVHAHKGCPMPFCVQLGVDDPQVPKQNCSPGILAIFSISSATAQTLLRQAPSSTCSTQLYRLIVTNGEI